MSSVAGGGIAGGVVGAMLIVTVIIICIVIVVKKVGWIYIAVVHGSVAEHCRLKPEVSWV